MCYKFYEIPVSCWVPDSYFNIFLCTLGILTLFFASWVLISLFSRNKGYVISSTKVSWDASRTHMDKIHVLSLTACQEEVVWFKESLVSPSVCPVGSSLCLTPCSLATPALQAYPIDTALRASLCSVVLSSSTSSCANLNSCLWNTHPYDVRIHFSGLRWGAFFHIYVSISNFRPP